MCFSYFPNNLSDGKYPEQRHLSLSFFPLISQVFCCSRPWAAGRGILLLKPHPCRGEITVILSLMHCWMRKGLIILQESEREAAIPAGTCHLCGAGRGKSEPETWEPREQGFRAVPPLTTVLIPAPRDPGAGAGGSFPSSHLATSFQRWGNRGPARGQGLRRPHCHLVPGGTASAPAQCPHGLFKMTMPSLWQRGPSLPVEERAPVVGVFRAHRSPPRSHT